MNQLYQQYFADTYLKSYGSMPVALYCSIYHIQQSIVELTEATSDSLGWLLMWSGFSGSWGIVSGKMNNGAKNMTLQSLTISTNWIFLYQFLLFIIKILTRISMMLIFWFSLISLIWSVLLSGNIHLLK